jgi:alpha-D-ribose 1-methylphosphonate 5-triphosphate synthase subunit PhnG
MPKNDSKDWLSWAIGLTGGVLLWEFFKPKAGPTPTQAAAAAGAPQGAYQNLGQVSMAIDATWKAFKAGQMTADQAMAKAQELADAANHFYDQGEDATVIYAQALALQDSIQQAVEAAKKPTPAF